ncbi:MAG: hypothetical protein ACI3XG_12390 [Faecousia sp.]
MSDLIIRPETPADYAAAERMAQPAFWNIHGPGCNEHMLVRRMRSSPDCPPRRTLPGDPGLPESAGRRESQ